MYMENMHEVGMQNLTDFPTKRWFAYNRTGSACTKGGIYQFDTELRTAAESTANSNGDVLPAVANYGRGKDGAFGNFIAVATTSTQPGGGTDSVFATSHCLCVAEASVGDNELVSVLVMGEIDLTLTTTGYGAAPGQLRAWRRVIAVDASSRGLLAAGSAANTNAKGIGVTTESATWAASGDAVVVSCYFNGINGAFQGR